MGDLIGPDVSHHQGAVDWSRVGDSCFFGFCKATEGVTFHDKRMAANRQGMRDAKLILKGLYHFARPGNNTAVTEADHFCDVVGGLEPGEVAVLDLETTHLSRQATGQWTRDWMKRAGERLGTVPWLYSFGPFLNAMDTSGLQQHPLWIAKYGLNNGTVPSSRPNTDRWANFTMWQFTSEGQQSGISGRCDLSLFEGTEEDLRRVVEGHALPPEGLHSFPTWGSGVNVRREPSTASAKVAVLAAPTTVKIKCQTRGQRVTVGGISNDMWSFIPSLGGFITNIYIDHPAQLLPGVPICP